MRTQPDIQYLFSTKLHFMLKLITHFVDSCMNERLFKYATFWRHKDRIFNVCKNCKKSAWRRGMHLNLQTNSVLGNTKEKD